jgi:nucleotide-binding universal stress UspA family protein
VSDRWYYGHPGRCLVDLSDEVDLLVVGRRGLGGFKGLLFGSVSTYVVHHADCPVVIIPAEPIDDELAD